MNVVVVGAGIGGLTAALSLKAVGIDRVQILESAARIEPLGVGINLLPHAVRELTELGWPISSRRSGSGRLSSPTTTAMDRGSGRSRVVLRLATTGRSTRCTAATCSCCCWRPYKSGSGSTP